MKTTGIPTNIQHYMTSTPIKSTIINLNRGNLFANAGFNLKECLCTGLILSLLCRETLFDHFRT